MQCPVCHNEIPDVPFCPLCGADMSKAIPEQKEIVEPEDDTGKKMLNAIEEMTKETESKEIEEEEDEEDYEDLVVKQPVSKKQPNKKPAKKKIPKEYRFNGINDDGYYNPVEPDSEESMEHSALLIISLSTVAVVLLIVLALVLIYYI